MAGGEHRAGNKAPHAASHGGRGEQDDGPNRWSFTGLGSFIGEQDDGV